jgi:hypothetical protein
VSGPNAGIGYLNGGADESAPVHSTPGARQGALAHTTPDLATGLTVAHTDPAHVWALVGWMGYMMEQACLRTARFRPRRPLRACRALMPPPPRAAAACRTWRSASASSTTTSRSRRMYALGACSSAVCLASRRLSWFRKASWCRTASGSDFTLRHLSLAVFRCGAVLSVCGGGRGGARLAEQAHGRGGETS